MLLLVLLLQLPGPPILTIFSNCCTGSKVISTMHKLLQSSSPCYLHDLITVQPSRSTGSSALVTLLQPSVDSSLKITDRSFRYTAPHLWNRLPPTVRILYQSGPSSSPSSSPSSRSDPAPLVDLSRGVFHSHLKLSFSQSLSLYSHLSLPQADLLEL